MFNKISNIVLCLRVLCLKLFPLLILFFTANVAKTLASENASTSTEQQCSALLNNSSLNLIDNHRVNLIEARWLEEQSSETKNKEPYQLPAHCVVKGKINERTSTIDGMQYSIGFELRLPANWNQRFLLQANTGNDGVVVPALGAFPNEPIPALAERFAVVSNNAGHENPRTSIVSGALFGQDPQARLDYGYQANQVITPVAKKIIQTFYKTAPRFSYAMGCSNGGRHTMVAASRLANEYDGFVAINPGFNLPKAAVQHAWDVQTLSAVDQTLSKALSPEDMQLVAQSVLEKCDDLDGLSDGSINAIEQCQSVFDLHSLSCPETKSNPKSDRPTSEARCLAHKKISALQKLFSGPVNSQGDELYSSWLFDAGIDGADWRRWKIEGPIAGLPFIAALGSSSLAQIFMTPPHALTDSEKTSPTPTDLLGFLRGFDFDKDAQSIYNTNELYTESAVDFMTPPDAEKLSELAESGSKLMVVHGTSDGVFSAKDTMNWYHALDHNHQGSAGAFARLYLVPGMNHCVGGPSTDQFDALTSMVKWVEEGQVPDEIIAKVNPNNPELPETWSKERSRKLCPFPSVARFQKPIRKSSDAEKGKKHLSGKSFEDFVCSP